MLAAARPPALPRAPKALIVPHAGYVYSGPVAATAYAALRPFARGISRVVLLGPAHRVYVRGAALPDAGAFATPLGAVLVDEASVRALAELPFVAPSELAHAAEHSLEVQLPFLQRALGEFTLVPLAVGRCSPEEVARILEALWGGDETLVLISSDLSHYLAYEEARTVDRSTAEAILALGPDALSHEQACGATPVNGLLVQARRHRLGARLLDLRNSGDTAGPREQVVGYGSFGFFAAGDRDGDRDGAAG
jgi:AmmeMemoRadiSam system protein B